jgi:hypothetical protein
MTFPVLTVNGILQDFGNYKDGTVANKCSVLELKQQYMHTYMSRVSALVLQTTSFQHRISSSYLSVAFKY